MSVDPNLSDLADAFKMGEHLPEPLPESPFPLFKSWLDAAFAQRITPNPNAMTVATIDADGTPSARVVLCRGIDTERGYVVFYTNRQSRKGDAIGANPRVAAVLHFDAFDKQVRIEGVAVPSPDEESDAYFATRTVAKRIGAWSSDQSRPVAGRAELEARVIETMRRFGVDPDDEDAADPESVPRPPHWGGYRIWASAVELWVGNRSRLHDRARWERSLAPASGGSADAPAMRAGPWSVTRLQP